jgi:hypothetical protein
LEIQGGSNMTGTNCDLFTHKSSRSYLNHLVRNYWQKSRLQYRLKHGPTCHCFCCYLVVLTVTTATRTATQRQNNDRKAGLFFIVCMFTVLELCLLSQRKLHNVTAYSCWKENFVPQTVSYDVTTMKYRTWTNKCWNKRQSIVFCMNCREFCSCAAHRSSADGCVLLPGGNQQRKVRVGA